VKEVWKTVKVAQEGLSKERINFLGTMERKRGEGFFKNFMYIRASKLAALLSSAIALAGRNSDVRRTAG
jgi:hypothetical protein